MTTSSSAAALLSAHPLYVRKKNMADLNEQEVSRRLSDYLQSCGLTPLGKQSPFIHDDDNLERSFEIDLAIGPTGTLGNRTEEHVSADKCTFEDASNSIDPIVRGLLRYSLFPKDQQSRMSWRWEANPNPVYGLAIEIENNTSKYLLGSLLAASIAGRWGLLILPDAPAVPRWIETIHRMMHKGAQSPIPSNVAIFTWPLLERHMNQCEQVDGHKSGGCAPSA